jgi:hypothetical protein
MKNINKKWIVVILTVLVVAGGYLLYSSKETSENLNIQLTPLEYQELFERLNRDGSVSIPSDEELQDVFEKLQADSENEPLSPEEVQDILIRLNT